VALMRPLSRRRVIWGGVALVVLVVIVVVLVVQGRADAEVKKHDPHGEAATSARAKADGALTAALDEVAAQLSLGKSLGSYLSDTCRATNPASMDPSITCERERMQIFALTDPLVDAHALAGRFVPPWSPGDGFCDADLTLDTACLQRADVALELVVEKAKTTPYAPGLSRWPKVVQTWVESAASPERLLVTVPVIVVDASSTYFVG
jgi:hypothetical protein